MKPNSEWVSYGVDACYRKPSDDRQGWVLLHAALVPGIVTVVVEEDWRNFIDAVKDGKFDI